MIKLVQISDCHIDDQRLAMGVDTQENLLKIINTLSIQDFNALLISGDLTHNGTLSSYQQLKKMLLPIRQPIYAFGGNHDNTENLKEVFADTLFSKITLGKWMIVCIDSVQLGKTSGFVTQKALERLDKILATSDSEYAVVALHHPIIPMNSTWDDSLSLENPQDLFKVLNKHSKIRAIVFGHAHEAAEFNQQNFDIISCPSTALQFTNETRIGFNEFNLHNNGSIEWQTQWI